MERGGGILGGLCKEAEEKGADYNEAVLCALVDAYNRCIEERRRARDLLKLHEKWAGWGIGGIVGPEG